MKGSILLTIIVLTTIVACRPGDVEQFNDAQLVSFYSFDGQNADDSSGYGFDGVANGSVTYVQDTPSGIGFAANLNGYKGGFINIPYNVFAGIVNYSVAFWIKDFDYGVLFTAISSDGPRSDFPRLIATTGRRFRFYTCYDNWDSTERFTYDTMGLMASGWHHIAITCEYRNDWRLNAERRLYVDGKLVATDYGNVDAYYSVHGFDEDIITRIQIGGDRNGAYDHCTSMLIDNVRFYTSTISSSLIQELYLDKK